MGWGSISELEQLPNMHKALGSKERDSGMVVCAFNPSNQSRGKQISESEESLVCRKSSRTAMATQEKPCLKKREGGEQEEKKRRMKEGEEMERKKFKIVSFIDYRIYDENKPKSPKMDAPQFLQCLPTIYEAIGSIFSIV